MTPPKCEDCPARAISYDGNLVEEGVCIDKLILCEEAVKDCGKEE